MPSELTGKTALVTGGANGIGLAVARELIACGARVWIADLRDANPERVAISIGAMGVVADVTDADSLSAVFEKIPELDIAVANAGTATEAPFDEITDENWERTISVNLTGLFRTVRMAATKMKPRRQGAIVLTASTNSYDGEPLLAAYNATKAGVLGILHTAANELGPWGIRVNAVNPGFIRTRLTKKAFDNEAVIKEYFRQVPLGRGGEPAEVAKAVAFLASGDASFITGAALLVDGGQMAAKFGTWRDGAAEFVTDHWRLL